MEGKREKFSISLEMSGISTDLVQKFTKQNRNQEGSDQEEEDEELELSLGLSLNGRFGVNPVWKKLKRSSSISNLVLGVGGVENSSTRVVEFETYAPLPRTRSLPTEAEAEWRRGKEFQSMRRMEARKKRMEKLRNVRVLKDKVSCVESGNGLNHLHGGIEISSSQGSLGSQRSGTASSGISDLEFEGGNQKPNLPPPLQDQSKPASKAVGKDTTTPNGSTKNALFDMPYVSTKEDGPNGHKIEGFLYRYKKGEEVRIVCVCHGMFLTPAEFIKHGGGGGDVEHPLKHIVVTPFPLL